MTKLSAILGSILVVAACDAPDDGLDASPARSVDLDDGDSPAPEPGATCEGELVELEPEEPEEEGEPCELIEGWWVCESADYNASMPPVPDKYWPQILCGEHAEGYFDAFVFDFKFRPRDPNKAIDPKFECRKVAANFLQLCDDVYCPPGETCKRIRKPGTPPIPRDLDTFDFFDASCTPPDATGQVTCTCDFNAEINIECSDCAKPGGC